MKNIKEIFRKTNKKKYGKIKKDAIKINKFDIKKHNTKRFKRFDIKKSNLKIVTILLLFLIILILFLTGYSLSKSFSEIKINSTAEISNPVIVVDSNEKINITAEKNIGEYRFSVRNYNDNEINEALLHYKIEIKADVDESINFEIYRDNVEIALNENTTDYFNIGKNEKKDHNYLLKIKYDKNKSKNIYNIIEKIQIKIHSEQKKI